MKKSLSHLPKDKREDLKLITQYLLEILPDGCEMIILYGSYARGNYTDYSQQVEDGIPTYFMSDYDILVVTKNRFKSHIINNMFRKVSERYYAEKGESKRAFTTTIQFINESIKDLNTAIARGYYFYTDIKKEGIMLYNSQNYKLARCRNLDYGEIRDLTKVYFDEKFNNGESFLKHARYAYNDEDYKLSSFMLHQSCENFYRSIILTFTLYNYKDHSLEELSGLAKTHSLEPSKAFPRDTEEEKRLFQLLTDAYIQSRYNSHFVVTKADIEALIPRIVLLRDITKKVCEAKIKEYEKLVKKNVLI